MKRTKVEKYNMEETVLGGIALYSGVFVLSVGVLLGSNFNISGANLNDGSELVEPTSLAINYDYNEYVDGNSELIEVFDNVPKESIIVPDGCYLTTEYYSYRTIIVTENGKDVEKIERKNAFKCIDSDGKEYYLPQRGYELGVEYKLYRGNEIVEENDERINLELKKR